MAKNSNIGWTQHTWNPWRGCSKISAGCKYCYFYREMQRWKDGKNWDSFNPKDFNKSKTTFRDPYKWKNRARVFVGSYTDFFHSKVPAAWRIAAWNVMRECEHIYQILTKRPGNILKFLPDDFGEGKWSKQFWIGVSIESTKQLRRLRSLAKVKEKYPDITAWVSFEPLLGEIDLNAEENKEFKSILKKHIDWVVIGGESGNNTGKYKFRNCESDWILKLKVDCMKLKCAVFIKQLGNHLARQFKLKDKHGKDELEFPAQFLVQNYPDVDYSYLDEKTDPNQLVLF